MLWIWRWIMLYFFNIVIFWLFTTCHHHYCPKIGQFCLNSQLCQIFKSQIPTHIPHQIYPDELASAQWQYEISFQREYAATASTMLLGRGAQHYYTPIQHQFKCTPECHNIHSGILTVRMSTAVWEGCLFKNGWIFGNPI